MQERYSGLAKENLRDKEGDRCGGEVI